MIPTDRARLLLVAMAEAGMVIPSQHPSTRSPEEAAVEDSQPYMAATGRSPEELTAILDVMHHQTHFEVLGVDQFADSAVIIKARIKTRPIQQWSVGRELNRRFRKIDRATDLARRFQDRPIIAAISWCS